MIAAGLAGCVALVLPGAGNADHTMSGSIDEAGNISGPSSPQSPGTHDFQVSDSATIHNYHLSGPGVDESTGVTETETVTWPG